MKWVGGNRVNPKLVKPIYVDLSLQQSFCFRDFTPLLVGFSRDGWAAKRLVEGGSQCGGRLSSTDCSVLLSPGRTHRPQAEKELDKQAAHASKELLTSSIIS